MLKCVQIIHIVFVLLTLFQFSWVIEVKLNNVIIVKEYVINLDEDPYNRVQAIIGDSRTPADVEIRNMFAHSLDEGNEILV